MSEQPKVVSIFTDGAAEPNPGPGGYGVILNYRSRRKELSGMFRLTTNNRMEVLAAIVSLEALKEACKVTLYSDSRYLVDTMAKGWARRWQTKGWRLSTRKQATNIDLWERLLVLCDKHDVQFVWVKGHAGNSANERCDQLSMQFLGKRGLPADEGYEQRPQTDSAPSTTGPSKMTKSSGTPIRITYEGQPCRKCSTPVVKRIPRGKRRRVQAYYFEFYFFCPGCHAFYMVEEAKRYNEDRPKLGSEA